MAMAGAVTAIISSRSKRLSSTKGKIEALKSEIKDIKEAGRRLDNLSLISKIDRKIFGYYPEEFPNKKQRKKEVDYRKRVLKKLQKGRNLTKDEVYNLF